MKHSKKELREHIKGLNTEILEFQDRCAYFSQKNHEYKEKYERLNEAHSAQLVQHSDYIKECIHLKQTVKEQEAAIEQLENKLQHYELAVSPKLLHSLPHIGEVREELLSLFTKMQRSYLIELIDEPEGNERAVKESLISIQSLLEAL